MWASLAVTASKLVVVAGSVLTSVAVMEWVERRGAAFIQDRLGPNRVGPLGLFQPIVDAVKLLFKEDITPSSVNKGLYYLAPAISVFVALVTFILLLLAFWGLNSQWGRAFKAIRENEARAEMLGVSLRNYKLMAFAIGSAFAGIGGALIAPLFGYIDPTMFALGFSFQFLLMVVVGGVGRFEGPLLGAMIVAILPEALRVTDKFFPVIFALAAILIMVFMPKGSVSAVDWAYKKITGKEEPHLTK